MSKMVWCWQFPVVNLNRKALLTPSPQSCHSRRPHLHHVPLTSFATSTLSRLCPRLSFVSAASLTTWALTVLYMLHTLPLCSRRSRYRQEIDETFKWGNWGEFNEGNFYHGVGRIKKGSQKDVEAPRASDGREPLLTPKPEKQRAGEIAETQRATEELGEACM